MSRPRTQGCQHCGATLEKFVLRDKRSPHLTCPCGKTRCTRYENVQFIAANSRRCSCPDCPNTVPAGAYLAHQRLRIFCSDKCKNRLKVGISERKCTGCGITVFRRPSRASGPVFHSTECHGHFLTLEYMKDSVGEYFEVCNRFLEQWAPIHYAESSIVALRHYICHFIKFARTQAAITCLDDIDSRMVTEYMAANGSKQGAGRPDLLIPFFDWLEIERLRSKPNPVKRKFHSTQVSEGTPRPYRPEEAKYIWDLLVSRGDERCRVIGAFGYESGLRGNEVCKVHLDDVDLLRQQVFVRLPNKGRRAGWVPFGELTAKYVGEWLKVRPACSHDYLLTNDNRGPMRTDSMRNLMKSIICKQFRSHEWPHGLDEFHFHRFRHTFATRMYARGMQTRTLMSVGRWKSEKALERYTEITGDAIAREYRQVTAKSEVIEATPRRQRVTLDTILGKLNDTSEP